MKLLITILMTIFGGAEASASGVECISLQNPRARVLIQSTREIGPQLLTVQIEGRTIYADVPVVEIETREMTTYRAPTLKNARNAPADLHLLIYRKEGLLLGSFNETSYVPVVPLLSLQCREIRQVRPTF